MRPQKAAPSGQMAWQQRNRKVTEHDSDRIVRILAMPRRVQPINSKKKTAVSQIVAHLVRGMHRELEPIQRLRFLLPWFGTRRPVVQIHSPRPFFLQLFFTSSAISGRLQKVNCLAILGRQKRNLCEVNAYSTAPYKRPLSLPLPD
jgi:hypothetical protein